MYKLTYIITVIILIGCSQKKNQETVSEETTTVEEENAEKKNNIYKDLINDIKNNNIDHLLSLINQGVDLNYVRNQYSDTTLLSLACKQGNLELVKVLIENGADINKSTGEFETHYTPLGASIISNHIEIVRYLTHANVSKTYASMYIKELDTLMIDLLLDVGVDINKPYSIDAEWEVSRLEDAFMKDENKLATYLIEKGAEINFGVINVLKTQEQFDIIKSSGFDLTSFKDQTRESTGEASIYSIITNKPKEVVQLLLDNGFRPSANTITTIFHSHTTLSIVLKHNKEVGNFIDINKTHEFEEFAAFDYSGGGKKVPDNKTNLISIAVLNNYQEAIKELLKFGANPNNPDIHGNFPIYYASEKNKKEIELLLSLTIDENTAQHFDLSISTTNRYKDYEGDFNQFKLSSDVLPDEYLTTFNAWTPGQVITNKELTILYGTNWKETIKDWYGLHESKPESMEIVEKKEMGDNTYLTYQFSVEEEDYRGNIVCIRSLKGGQWQSEISFKSVKDVRLGASGNSFSYNGQIDYTTDPKQLVLTRSVTSLLFHYMDIDYSTIDLPMNHEMVTVYEFEIIDNSSLEVKQKGKTEQHNFPLTKEGIERVKKNNSVQYYIDQTNTLDESYENEKREIIAYLNRVQEELLKK